MGGATESHGHSYSYRAGLRIVAGFVINLRHAEFFGVFFFWHKNSLISTVKQGTPKKADHFPHGLS